MKKFLPLPIWDIRRLEQYFNEMSKKGLHLKKLINRTAEFEKDAPEDYIYKLRPLKKYKHFKFYKSKFVQPEKEDLSNIKKMDEFTDAGYTYLGRFRNLFVFRARKEDIKSEVEIEHAEQKRIRNLLINNNIFVLMLAVFFLWTTLPYAINPLWESNLFYIFVNEPNMFLYFTFIFMLLISIIRLIPYFIQIQHEKDLSTDKIVSWNIKSRRYKRSNWILRVLTVVFVLILMLPEFNHSKHAIEEAKQECNIDFLTLDDIENIQDNEKVIYRDAYMSLNEVHVTKGLLTNMEYSYFEDIIIDGREGDDTYYEYKGVECDISVYYYEFVSKNIANHFFQSMLNDYWFLKVDEMCKMESEVFDLVYAPCLEDSRNFLYMFIIRNNQVWRIFYDGDKDAYEFLEFVEQKYNE